MAQLANLWRPEMGTTARFHRNDASRTLTEKIQNLGAPQLITQNCATSTISSTHLEHIFRQIDADRDSIRHDRSPLWIIADPPWHIDAVGGRLHHQSPRTPECPTRRLPAYICNIHGIAKLRLQSAGNDNYTT
jgi:hypothetical protein